VPERISVSVCYFDPFDDTVNTADTFASRDADEDESFVTPPFSPGVLDLPVIIVAG